MNETEKHAIRDCNSLLVSNLDAKIIAPVLFSKSFLTEDQMMKLFSSTDIRRNVCQLFLLNVVKTCPFEAFLWALRSESHSCFLADKLEECKKRLEQCEENTDKQTETLNTPSEEQGRLPIDTITKPVNRISVNTSHRRKISLIAHKLKSLSHDGQMEKLKEHTKTILDNFNKKKLSVSYKKSVTVQMQLADLAFTALEAEVIARRVKYDLTLYGSAVFDQMKGLVPFTSNPTMSSMTFLARFGSSLTMLESLDVGLQYLDIAKHHAVQIEPGQETGMVYYIEGNLLTQKYEKEPNEQLKEKVLKTAEIAISQFDKETDQIRLDYQRMIMLKMVFCYLGLGLFCKSISNVKVSTTDLNAAKKLLNFVEKPEVWEGMEVRRKMLYHVAKAEFSRKESNMEVARCHAKEAQKIAKQFKWTTELPNICLLIDDIEKSLETKYSFSETENIDKLISKILNSADTES